jgi:large subunit ribosomal protein L24
MKIKKNDKVIVTAGKDKGKTGTVTHAIPKENKVIVEGVNIRKKHQKPRRGGQQGQILEKSLPIHVSNVMLVDPKSGKPTRVGIERKNGKRARVTKKSKSELV